MGKFSYSSSDYYQLAQTESAYARLILDAIKFEVTRLAIVELQSSCNKNRAIFPIGFLTPAPTISYKTNLIFPSILQLKNMGIAPVNTHPVPPSPEPSEIELESASPSTPEPYKSKSGSASPSTPESSEIKLRGSPSTSDSSATDPIDVPADPYIQYKKRPVYTRTRIEENDMNIYVKMMEESKWDDPINALVQIRPSPTTRVEKYKDAYGLLKSFTTDPTIVTIYLEPDSISVVLSDFQFVDVNDVMSV